MRALTTGLFAVGALVSGCATESSSAPDALAFTGTWIATQIDGEPIEIGVDAAGMPWFELTDTTLYGNFGCNTGGRVARRHARPRVPGRDVPGLTG